MPVIDDLMVTAEQLLSPPQQGQQLPHVQRERQELLQCLLLTPPPPPPPAVGSVEAAVAETLKDLEALTAANFFDDDDFFPPPSPPPPTAGGLERQQQQQLSTPPTEVNDVSQSSTSSTSACRGSSPPAAMDICVEEEDGEEDDVVERYWVEKDGQAEKERMEEFFSKHELEERALCEKQEQRDEQEGCPLKDNNTLAYSIVSALSHSVTPDELERIREHVRRREVSQHRAVMQIRLDRVRRRLEQEGMPADDAFGYADFRIRAYALARGLQPGACPPEDINDLLRNSNRDADSARTVAATAAANAMSRYRATRHCTEGDDPEDYPPKVLLAPLKAELREKLAHGSRDSAVWSDAEGFAMGVLDRLMEERRRREINFALAEEFILDEEEEHHQPQPAAATGDVVDGTRSKISPEKEKNPEQSEAGNSSSSRKNPAARCLLPDFAAAAAKPAAAAAAAAAPLRVRYGDRVIAPAGEAQPGTSGGGGSNPVSTMAEIRRRQREKAAAAPAARPARVPANFVEMDFSQTRKRDNLVRELEVQISECWWVRIETRTGLDHRKVAKGLSGVWTCDLLALVEKDPHQGTIRNKITLPANAGPALLKAVHYLYGDADYNPADLL